MTPRDIIFIVVILFGLGVGFFIIHYISQTAINKLVQIPAIKESNRSVEALEGAQTNVVNHIDYVFLAVFIALALGVIITGYFIRGYPVFMILYFLILIIAAASSMLLSNVWDKFSTQPVFSTTLASMPITNLIISHLPVYIVVIGMLGTFAMFMNYSPGGRVE